MELPEYAEKIIERLRSRGFEAYAVGGCVRDLILNTVPKDYDFTTSARPEEIKLAFADCKTYDCGLRFGTVGVLFGGRTAEITTFRREGGYSDSRRPDEVFFTRNLTEDLKRRDFTINAMAYSHETGLVDPFGGKADLARGTIRAVGEAEERFREDALRILRALRFASCLGFRLEDGTSAAIHRCGSLLEKISGERICAELARLLCGKDCAAVLREYPDVFAVVIPEISACVGFEQHTKYHDRDIYEHTIAAVAAVEPIPHLRLAMLLHDLAKPSYFTLTDGTGHFKGHAKGSLQIAQRVTKQLKMDSASAERVCALVQYHDMVIENRVPLLKRYLNRFGAELLNDLIQVHIADDSAKAEAFRERITEYRKASETVRVILEEEQCFQFRDLAINGNDLLSLGLSGKQIGDMLARLLDDVMDEKCENKKETLLKAAVKYKEINE